jgi:ribosome biogenesis GTPase
VAGHGRQAFLRGDDGRTMVGVTRGRRSDLCVGDRVCVAPTSPGQVVIEAVLPRRNEVARSDAMRTKRLAANVDRVAIVIAPDPPFSEELLMRAAISATVAAVKVAIIANKVDLADADPAFERRLAVYEGLGYPVFRVSARHRPVEAVTTLVPLLADTTTLLMGQSGMGKSTLVNVLVPDAGLETREISAALSAGRHTTTFTRMFEHAVAGDAQRAARIVDSPGFQTFGLAHISLSQLEHAMPEFDPFRGRCRYNDCTHRDEPGCAIRQAQAEGRIDARRYEIHLRIAEEVRWASRP